MSEFETVADAAAFDAAVAGDELVIAKFQTRTCVICRRLEPGLRQLQARTDDGLRILEVDAEELPALTERYNIQGVPTLILFRNGGELGRRDGFQTVSMLRDWIAPHIAA